MKTKLFIGLICFIATASSAFAQAPEAIKIDEFGSVQCEDYLARMDYLISEANNNPSSRVFVLVYEGKTQRYKYRNGIDFTIESVLPQYGLASARIRSMKKYLPLRGVSTERFVFIKAGFRENFTVEIWGVPAGSIEPEPTPTLAKMKYRKGKPAGFCLGCCEP